jgi:transposase-like protein
VGDKWKTEQIVKAVQASDGLVSLAAKQLGCVPMTIYKRAKRCPKIQQAIDDARENLVDEAVKALRTSVVKREGWAVALVVKTLGKGRGYVERQESQTLSVDLSQLDAKQLERLAAGEDILTVLATPRASRDRTQAQTQPGDGE